MFAERLIARDNWIVAAALAGATILAWAWLARPMPTAPMAAPDSLAYFTTAFTMWSLMMVAMMLPSASPMILLYTRFARIRFGRGAAAGTAAFVLAYVLIWTSFSAIAALLQAALVGGGWVGEMELAIKLYHKRQLGYLRNDLLPWRNTLRSLRPAAG